MNLIDNPYFKQCTSKFQCHYPAILMTNIYPVNFVTKISTENTIWKINEKHFYTISHYIPYVINIFVTSITYPDTAKQG